MRAYSMDLRDRVLAACDDGDPTTEVAERFAVSPAWVRRRRQRRRETGETGPRPSGHRPRSWAADADRIRAAIADTPDATLAEVRARLALPFALTTLWRAVAALGLTVKKKRSGRPSGTPRG